MGEEEARQFVPEEIASNEKADDFEPVVVGGGENTNNKSDNISKSLLPFGIGGLYFKNEERSKEDTGELSWRCEKWITKIRTKAKNNSEVNSFLSQFLETEVDDLLQRNFYDEKKTQTDKKRLLLYKDMQDLLAELHNGIDFEGWNVELGLVEYLKKLDNYIVKKDFKEGVCDSNHDIKDIATGDLSVLPDSLRLDQAEFLSPEELRGWHQGYNVGEIDFNKEAEVLSLIDIIKNPSNETIKYLANRILTNDMDFRENFKTAMSIFNKKPAVAGKFLMDLIRQETDLYRRALLGRTMYELEFNKITVTDVGVKYLDRNYDLGNYNDPNNHANRLTSEGEIGIFDSKDELLGYFYLGDLISSGDNVETEVKDINEETLFGNQLNQTPKEKTKRLKYLKEFKRHYYKLAEDKIFSETGIRLNNLTFREQAWFILYLKNCDEGVKNKIKKFLETFGEDGLKTFMAMEFDAGMGERILTLSETLPESLVTVIFSKYNELAERALDVTKYITDVVKQKVDQNTLIQITNNLLRRGKELLENFAQPTEDTMNTQEVLLSLGKIKGDVVFFASTFKTLFKNKEKVDFSEVHGLDFQRQSINWLDDTTKDEMLSISQKN
ncbi:MAG: hypothetical protein ABIJ23_00700 [Candidatus Magasanikbacteria bacterium]